MSQLPYSNPPPPPLPPGFDFFQQDPRLLAPARRASVMLFVLGTLALVFGLIAAIITWFVPGDQLMPDARMNLPPLPPGVTVDEIVHLGYTIIGVVLAIVGVVLIVLGLFVRRGRRGACITAMVFCILGILYFAFSLLVTMAQESQNPPRLVAAACFGVMALALLILALVWLIQALRASAQVALARQQYQMQILQSQQQAPPPPPGSGTGWQRGYGMSPPPPPA